MTGRLDYVASETPCAWCGHAFGWHYYWFDNDAPCVHEFEMPDACMCIGFQEPTT